MATRAVTGSSRLNFTLGEIAWGSTIEAGIYKLKHTNIEQSVGRQSNAPTVAISGVHVGGPYDGKKFAYTNSLQEQALGKIAALLTASGLPDTYKFSGGLKELVLLIEKQLLNKVGEYAITVRKDDKDNDRNDFTLKRLIKASRAVEEEEEEEIEEEPAPRRRKPAPEPEDEEEEEAPPRRRKPVPVEDEEEEEEPAPPPRKRKPVPVEEEIEDEEEDPPPTRRARR